MSTTLQPPKGFTTNQLVFSDAFEGGQLATGSWNTFMTSVSTAGQAWDSNGLGGSGVGGIYDADYDEPYEVSVNNGLTLGAVVQNVLGADYIGGAVVPQNYPVTAGVVDTYGKMEFDGGYLQISMKQPSGDGSWPSLWLLPGSGAGNVGNNFEIDIQEGGYLDGSANPNDVFSYHLHTSAGTFGGSIDTGVDLTAAFHTYAINWIPGKSITWYLDGVAVAEITSAEATIPNEPMELIMSNQVATSLASSWRTSLDASTPESMPMEIGGVQLYQVAGSGETVTGANVVAAPLAAPTVSIGSSGVTTKQVSQIIAGTVDIADAGTTVTIFDGSVAVGNATAGANGAWSTSVSLIGQGVNILKATAANASGTGVSNSVDYTLHSVSPTVTITSAGESVLQAQQTVSGVVDVADAGSTVVILDGDVKIGSASVASNGAWSTAVTLANQGANLLTATDANIAGTGTSNAIKYTLQTPTITQPSTTTIVSSLSGQTFALGNANYAITLGGYSNNVTAGDGDDSVSPGAGQETVHLGDGTDKVTLAGFGNSVTGGAGDDTVTGGLGNDNVVLGGGVDKVSLSGYYNAVKVGDGSDILSAGSGNDTILAGGGADTVSLSGYYNSVTLGAGSDVVNGGLGNDSIILQSSHATVNVVGGYEQLTLQGSAVANIFDGGTSMSVDIATSSASAVISGFADDHSGTIVFSNGAGGYSSASQVLSALHSDGHGGALLSLGAGSIDFAGASPTSFSSGMFGFR